MTEATITTTFDADDHYRDPVGSCDAGQMHRSAWSAPPLGAGPTSRLYHRAEAAYLGRGWSDWKRRMAAPPVMGPTRAKGPVGFRSLVEHCSDSTCRDVAALHPVDADPAASMVAVFLMRSQTSEPACRGALADARWLLQIAPRSRCSRPGSGWLRRNRAGWRALAGGRRGRGEVVEAIANAIRPLQLTPREGKRGGWIAEAEVSGGARGAKRHVETNVRSGPAAARHWPPGTAKRLHCSQPQRPAHRGALADAHWLPQLTPCGRGSLVGSGWPWRKRAGWFVEAGGHNRSRGAASDNAVAIVLPQLGPREGKRACIGGDARLAGDTRHRECPGPWTACRRQARTGSTTTFSVNGRNSSSTVSLRPSCTVWPGAIVHVAARVFVVHRAADFFLVAAAALCLGHVAAIVGGEAASAGERRGPTLPSFRTRTVASRRAGGRGAPASTSWAPRARWALEGRVRAGHRRRMRRSRVNGAFRALYLGACPSCSAAWRPWTSEDDAWKSSSGEARSWAEHLIVGDPHVRHHQRGVGQVGGRRGSDDPAAPAEASGGRAPRRGGRRRGAAVLTSGGRARAAVALAVTIILAAVRAGDATGTERVVDAGSATGPLEVRAEWRQRLSYPSPHRDGFRDFATAGHAEPGAGPGRRNPSEDFSLSVETVNSTGWGPMQRRLLATTAHVVLGQETWILPGHLARASDWCRRHGWESVLAPAAVGPGGGASGGVAIFARVGMGLRYPHVGPHILEEGRAVAGFLEPPGHRTMLAASIYLRDGKGVKDANKATMSLVGQCAAAQGTDCMLLCGGDFQCGPGCIEGSGFPRQVRGKVLAAASTRGTYRTRAAASTLDFFVVSCDLALAVEEVGLVEGSGIKGHVPVRLTFAPRPVALKGLAIRSPPKLELDRVFGPVPPPQDWRGARRLADEAHEVAMASGDAIKVQKSIDAAYANWCQVAERELADVTGVAPAKWGLRGRTPKLRWATILPEKTAAGAPSAAAQATWLRGFASELGRIADLLTAEIGTGIYIDPSPAGTNRPHGATFATPVRGGYGGCAGRGAAQQGVGGRPRPVTDLRACEEVVEEIARELRHNVCGDGSSSGDRGGGGSDARASGGVEEGAMRSTSKLISLAERVRAALAQARQSAVHDDFGLCDDITSAIKELEVEEKGKEAERDSRNRDQWRAWLESDWSTGARRAHSATKLPVEWKPTVVDVGGGGTSASPLALLDSMRRKYVQYWGATEDPFEYRWSGLCRPLERLTPSQLRAASLAFPKRTTMAYDGFHVRHFAMLSEEGLNALAVILEVVEATSRWPSQLGVVTTPMLPKPKGGHRLIGKLTGLYRLWAKARRPHAEAWESANDRPYLAAAAGSGPIDAVFRQAMRQESSAASGDVAITVLEDMEAFYETLCRNGLASEADTLGFPTCILRASLSMYAAPRMVSMGQFVAKETYARRGIIAGCGFATTLTKISYIRRFDRLVKEIPDVSKLDVYIDDVAITTQGPRRKAVAEAIKAHECLRRALYEGDGLKLAPQKASVVASDRAAGKFVATAVGREGAEAECAANLGVDVTAGGRRSRIGRNSKWRTRGRIGVGRGRKLWSLSKTIGRKALRIFTTGVAPAMCHGAQVWGLSDVEARRARQVAAETMRPRSRCRSLTAVQLINDMPTAMWETAVAVEYSRVVWRACTRREYAADRGASLSDIRVQWETAHDRIKGTVSSYAQDVARGGGRASAAAARKAWAEVRGPVGATAMTLARLGWSMKSAFVMVDAYGVEVPLTTTAPALVRHLLKEAVKDAAERFVAARWAKKDPALEGRRVCADLAMRQIKTACGGKLNGLQLGAYRAAVCGGIYTRHRAVADGYEVDDECIHCGAKGDTVYHRVFNCPHTKAAVLEQVPRWLYEEAGRARPTDIFWSTSLFPHPADDWPRPAADFSGLIVGDEDGSSGLELWADPMEGFGGNVYSDGSCEHSPIRGLSRAAAAAVQVDEHGRRVRAIYLPVPRHLPQTSQAGEHVGVATARRTAARAARIRCDCENVVRAVNAPARTALAPSKLYAGIVLDGFSRAGDKKVAGTTVEWVKAHRTEHEAMDAATLADVRGNAAADALAGEAVLMHPQPSHDQKVLLEYYLKRAPLVARAIGAALALFPSAEAQRLKRRSAPTTAGEAEARDQHYWQFGQGLWRCDRCGTWAHGEELKQRHYAERCPGHVAHRRAEAWTANGHKLAMVTGVAPFAFCARCGAWGNRRARKLDKPCQGPTPAGTMALSRIAKGKHPWRRRLCGGGEGSRTNITVVATFDKANRAWQTAGRGRKVTKRSVAVRSPPVCGEEGAAGAAGDVTGGSEGAGGAEPGVDFPQADDGGGGEKQERSDIVADDLWDEDPFGHGGDLNQASDGLRSARTCEVGAAGRTELHGGGISEGVGGREAPLKPGTGGAADEGVEATRRGAVGVGGNAPSRLEEVKRRVRRRIEVKSRGDAAVAGSIGANGNDCSMRDAATGEGTQVEESARAESASSNSTCGAREGLGGSHEACATAAAALDLRARVAAAVAAEWGAAQLVPHVLAASPPSGSAAPLEGRKEGALDHRPHRTTLQDRPENLGAGPSRVRPDEEPGDGDGLPGEREEAGAPRCPTSRPRQPRGGAVAAWREGGEEPPGGSPQSTLNARNEWGRYPDGDDGHDRDSAASSSSILVCSSNCGSSSSKHPSRAVGKAAVVDGVDRTSGVARAAGRPSDGHSDERANTRSRPPTLSDDVGGDGTAEDGATIRKGEKRARGGGTEPEGEDRSEGRRRRVRGRACQEHADGTARLGGAGEEPFPLMSSASEYRDAGGVPGAGSGSGGGLGVDAELRRSGGGVSGGGAASWRSVSPPGPGLMWGKQDSASSLYRNPDRLRADRVGVSAFPRAAGSAWAARGTSADLRAANDRERQIDTHRHLHAGLSAECAAHRRHVERGLRADHADLLRRTRGGRGSRCSPYLQKARPSPPHGRGGEGGCHPGRRPEADPYTSWAYFLHLTGRSTTRCGSHWRLA